MTVEFPLDQAQAVIMTLPHLLAGQHDDIPATRKRAIFSACVKEPLKAILSFYESILRTTRKRALPLIIRS
jgi:hypothetical protein